MKKKIIGFIVLVLILVGIIFIVKSKNEVITSKNFEEKMLSRADFIVRDKYAYLYSSDGKRIYNEKIKKKTGFFNHISGIRLMNNKGGVITDKGKFVLKIGDYRGIDLSNGLFLVNDTKLYNSKGKLINTLGKDDKWYKNADSKALVSYVFKDNQYIFYNYEGREIMKLKKEGKDVPALSSNSKMTFKSLVFYNGKTYIIDGIKAKNIAQFVYNYVYTVFKVSENDDLILRSTDSNYFALIKNDKLLFKDKEAVMMQFRGTNVIGGFKEDNGYNTYLLDESGQKVIKINKNVEYIDNKHYVIQKDGVTTLFNNNRKKELKCLSVRNSGYKEKYFILTVKAGCGSSKNAGKEVLVGRNGNFIENIYYDKIEAIYNNKMVVKDNNKYYLKKIKGGIISKKYDGMGTMFSHKYFLVKENDKDFIIDFKGRERYKFKKDESYEVMNHNHPDVIYIQNISYRVAYNLMTKKKVAKTDQHIISFIFDDVFFKTNKKPTVYYTYSGKEIK